MKQPELGSSSVTVTASLAFGRTLNYLDQRPDVSRGEPVFIYHLSGKTNTSRETSGLFLSCKY